MEIVAKTFFGLEDVLADEIKELGGKNIRKGNRVVEFEGNQELLYKANFWLRTAISVLKPIETFKFKDQDDLKRKLSNVRFSTYMRSNQTFAVKGAVHSKHFNFSKYAMLMLKDAIVDFFKAYDGSRPSVNKERPHILFDIHVSDNDCTISLNSSGAPLFQRGYRKQTGEAPLNEAIAAGLIMLSGWDKKSAFHDPMCGSGTIVIEAAMMAHGIAPNLARKHYSFQNWNDYDSNLWDKVYSESPRIPNRSINFDISGSDTSTDMILIARGNTKMLPLGNSVKFTAIELKDYKPTSDEGTVILNPPYGERLEDQERTEELYKEIGDCFKHNFGGFTCWVISSNREALKKLELKPAKKIQLYNGSLPCEFRSYQIFKGSLIEHKYGEVKREKRRSPRKLDK